MKEKQFASPSWESWLEAINLAFQHPAVRQVGQRLLEILAHRAARQLGLDHPMDGWSLDRQGLESGLIIQTLEGRKEAMRFLSALADLLCRVSGPAVSQPVRAALEAADLFRATQSP